MPSRSWKQSWGEWIVVLVILTAAAAVEVGVVFPKHRAIQKIKKRTAVLSAEIERSSNDIEELAKLADENIPATDFTIGPEEEILPKLLELIADLGNRHHLEIVSMKPQSLQAVESPIGDNSGLEVEVERLLIAMTVRARFRDLGDYFEALESIPILVSVRALKLEKERAESPTLLANFVIETFSIKAHESKKT
jgi:Tfp pilus assembly protein PilO